MAEINITKDEFITNYAKMTVKEMEQLYGVSSIQIISLARKYNCLKGKGAKPKRNKLIITED